MKNTIFLAGIVLGLWACKSQDDIYKKIKNAGACSENPQSFIGFHLHSLIVLTIISSF